MYFTGASAAGSAGGGAAPALVGLLSNPVTAAIGVIGSVVLGFIRAHHQQALQVEHATLSGVIPGVKQSYDSIVTDFNSGKLTAQQASSQVDGVLSGYDDFVYKQHGVKRKNGNGADKIYDLWVKPIADKLKAAFSAGDAQVSVHYTAYTGKGENPPDYVATVDDPDSLNPFTWGSSSASAFVDEVKADPLAAAKHHWVLLLVLVVLAVWWFRR